MAYLSNGTEGAMEMERLCKRCIHYEDCPIILLHFLWNYDQVKDETKHIALSALWPENDDGTNADCLMFVPHRTVQTHAPDYLDNLEEMQAMIERMIDEMTDEATQ